MAYCKNCGAYIPDGQAVCLACGYDPAEEEREQAAAAASAAAAAAANAAASHQESTAEYNAEMRKKLEEQRKRAREQNLKWAEEQRKQREEQAAKEAARKAQQEKDREWARQEYERRKAQQAQQNSSGAGNTANQPGYTGSGHYYYGSDADGDSARSGQGNKALAALSYLSFLFVLPSIFAPQDEYARFHARQGLKLFVFGIVADLVTSFIGLGWLAVLARLYLIYKGMSNALNGRKEPLPWIGTMGNS